MIPRQSRYAVRFAETARDLGRCQALRHRAFFGGEGRDADAFDARCRHVMVEARNGRLACTFRLLPLGCGAEIGGSYSAQFYELSPLQAFAGRLVEMGRFCIEPDLNDPDVLRVAWTFLAGFVEREGVEMLIGCSSFRGTDAVAYEDAFAVLRERHLAPKRWLPRVKAPNVFRFAARLRRAPDPRRAMKAMPPLLRSYLAMGGWVSDHAVVDREMDTLHVFTALEVARIPPARRRALGGA